MFFVVDTLPRGISPPARESRQTQRSRRTESKINNKKSASSLLDLPNDILLMIFDLLAAPFKITHRSDADPYPKRTPLAERFKHVDASIAAGRALFHLGMTCRFLQNSIRDHYWPNKLVFSLVRCDRHRRTLCLPLTQAPWGTEPLYEMIVPKAGERMFVRKLDVDTYDLEPILSSFFDLERREARTNMTYWRGLLIKWSHKRAVKRLMREYSCLTNVEDLTVRVQGLATLDMKNRGRGANFYPFDPMRRAGFLTDNFFLGIIWRYLFEFLPACRRVYVHRTPLQFDNDDLSRLKRFISMVDPPSNVPSLSWRYKLLPDPGRRCWPSDSVMIRVFPKFLAMCDSEMCAKVNRMIKNKLWNKSEESTTIARADTTKPGN